MYYFHTFLQLPYFAQMFLFPLFIVSFIHRAASNGFCIFLSVCNFSCNRKFFAKDARSHYCASIAYNIHYLYTFLTIPLLYMQLLPRFYRSRAVARMFRVFYGLTCGSVVFSLVVKYHVAAVVK